MTAITQHIPNFSHGISQQPDYLKRPGQVRDMLNALPDVTQGLLKRPGGRRINSLKTTTGGKWFTIYRDDKEQYVVQYKDGLFRVWSLLDGLPRVVRYTDKPDGTYPRPGEGENTPNPGLGSCDPAAFSAAIDAYRVAKQNADAVRNQINKLQAEIDRVTSGTSRKLFYEVKSKGDSWYEVITGHVVRRGALFLDGQTFDINKPTQIQTNEKLIIGRKRLSRVNMQIPGATPGGLDIVTGDVYEYEIVPKNASSDPAADYRNQIDVLKAQLGPLETIEAQKREAYETQALTCGVTSSPYARNATPEVPDYLADATPQDLDVLTVNDYTFITNRKRDVVMGGDVSKVRPYEAFINIDTLAYNTEYAVDLSWDGNTTTTPVDKATKLTVSPASWRRSDGGTGDFTDTKTFTISQGSGQNLRFSLETRGQQLPVSNSDASKGYYTKYKTTLTLINGGSGWKTGDVIEVEMSKKKYRVRIVATGTETVYASAGSGAALTPADSTTGTLSVKDLLNDLKTNIETNTFGVTATPVGSGLYLTAPKPFTVAVRAGHYMSAFTNEVNNIGRLPLECKNGYIVKVVNSGEKEDDYYLEFKGKGGNDGTGIWEETLKPGIATNFAYSSMPHQLKRLEDGTFQFGPVDWESRLVGDDTSNPIPSFVGKSINKIFFFRNRLGFLTDENVVLSRAGDYFNFWSKTALTVQPSDPVDISASSTFPAILYDAVPFMQGVVLFSATQQFILTTDQDVFGPETAKLILMSTFRYSPEIKPFNMGTTIGFVNRSGRYARFMEMANINRERPPELIEQSKIVPELLPRELNCVADSRENDLVVFGSNASSGSQSSEVYGYRYFNDGEKRIQSAWFRWELAGKLEHHAVLEDSYFTVTLHDTINGPKLWLMRYDLTVRSTTGYTDGSAYINDENGIAYPVCLDNYVVANVTDFQFYPHLNETYFLLPWSHDESNRVVAFDIGNSKLQGRMIYPQIVTDSLGTWCILEGDWSGSRLALGFDYEMQVTLPHLYVQKEDSTANKVTADTRSSLTISRVKFEFGESGTFKTIIKRKGRPDYVQEWETRPSDEYHADTHSVAPERVLEVPIYDRNTNVFIELYSTHPTPATLFAMDWEGNYSAMFYKRV